MYSRIPTELVMGLLGAVDHALGTSGLESTLTHILAHGHFESYIMLLLRHKIRNIMLKAWLS
jgi:hypothetical protein